MCVHAHTGVKIHMTLSILNNWKDTGIFSLGLKVFVQIKESYCCRTNYPKALWHSTASIYFSHLSVSWADSALEGLPLVCGAAGGSALNWV